MAVLTLNANRSVILTSTWRFVRAGDISYFTDPSTSYDAITFDLSGIPEGAEIQSASVSASRWGSGEIRTMNGVDDDRAGINPSSITPGGELRITFTYKANGRMGSGKTGTLSDTAGWNNITLSVTYEMPYTAPTAPTQLSVSKAMATPGESVILSWSGAKAGNNVPIIGYGVFRASSADGEYTLLAETNAETLNLSVAAPASAGSYFYKVMALGGVDGYNSALSSAYAQVSVAVTAPKAPSALSLSASKQYPGGSAVLSFSGASAGENNQIRGYALWQSSLADSGYEKANTITSTAASGSFTVTAPQSGSRYFKVQTLGRNMDGDLSAIYATLTADLSGTSDYTVSSETVDAGTAISITLLSNTNKAHTLTVSIGEYSQTVQSAAGATSITFTPPLSWLNAMPESETAPMKLSLKTAGAGTIEKTAHLRCPDDVGPVVSGAYAVRIDNDIPASWGVYVQGKSLAEIHLEQAAQTAYGSPIVNYRMEGALMAAESADVPFSMDTGYLNAGEVPIIITATDARGRTGSQQLTLSVEAYQLPALQNIVTLRCDAEGNEQDEGTYANVEADLIYSSCSGNNVVSVAVSYRLNGSNTWTAAGNMASGQLIFGSGQLDIGKNYDTCYIITDSLGGEMVYYDVITRATPELHIRRGGGAWAFGGIADENGALKIYGDMTMTGRLRMGMENAGKLLYIAPDGKAMPLALGEGMYIADGVLYLGTPPGKGELLSGLPVGSKIRIEEENGQAWYTLVASDYSGGCLLLRDEKIADGQYAGEKPSSSYASKYAGSYLDNAMGSFYEAFPEATKEYIMAVNIPIRENASSGASAGTLERKAFALSAVELGLDGSAHEGKQIDYLGTVNIGDDYWTREPVSGMDGYAYFVNASGTRASDYMTTQHGRRPAFCVYKNTPVYSVDGGYAPGTSTGTVKAICGLVLAGQVKCGEV